MVSSENERIYCPKCGIEYPFHIILCSKCHVEVVIKNIKPFIISIVGSRQYTNSRKIRDFVYEMSKEYGERLVIVSGGYTQGIDTFVKKWSLYLLESGQYKEMPPAYFKWNLYCVKSRYEKNGKPNYGLPYRPYHYKQRNTELVKYSDVVYAFIPSDLILEESGEICDICEIALKHKKQVFQIGTREGNCEVMKIRKELKSKNKS